MLDLLKVVIINPSKQNKVHKEYKMKYFNLEEAYQAQVIAVVDFLEPDFDDIGEPEQVLPAGWVERRKSAMAFFGIPNGNPSTERVCWLADEGLVDHPEAKSFVFSKV